MICVYLCSSVVSRLRSQNLALAIFDLDNPLLRGDSHHVWGQFLVENHIVDGAVYARENNRYYAEYQAGTLDIMEFLAFVLSPLAQHDRAALDGWHRQYRPAQIPPITNA